MRPSKSHIAGLVVCVVVEVVLLAFIIIEPTLRFSTRSVSWLFLAAVLALAIVEDYLGLREQSTGRSYLMPRAALTATSVVLLWICIVVKFIIGDFGGLLALLFMAVVITYRVITRWK